MIKQAQFYILIIVMISFVGCDKNKLATNKELILGTWISLDKTDTLDFVDNNSFFKSNLGMSYDHFDYQLLKDSIEIGYNGFHYILIHPTMHKYQLVGNKLTIDFDNTNCYGFTPKKITYSKQL